MFQHGNERWPIAGDQSIHRIQISDVLEARPDHRLDPAGDGQPIEPDPEQEL